MKTLELQRRDVTFVEGQRNSYDPEGDVHRRSYICVRMKEKEFNTAVQPYLRGYGVRHLTQSRTLCDLREFGGTNGEVWVTKVRGTGRVHIHMLQEDIDIATDEIYVVMWRRNFLPRVFKRARWLDLDTILLSILDGRTRPHWFMRLFL